MERHRIANLMIERIDLVHVGEVQGIKVKWRELGWDALIGEFAQRASARNWWRSKPDGRHTGNLCAPDISSPGARRVVMPTTATSTMMTLLEGWHAVSTGSTSWTPV